MDSKDAVPLSTAARAPIAASPSFLIRAPLSSEENESPIGSPAAGDEEAEDFESASGSGDEGEEQRAAGAGKGLPLQRRDSMPKAHVTEDGDEAEREVFEEGVGEEEEVEVDDGGDGFSAAARVPSVDQNPTLEGEGGVLDGEADDPSLKTAVSVAAGGEGQPENPEGEPGMDSSPPEESSKDGVSVSVDSSPQNAPMKPIEGEAVAAAVATDSYGADVGAADGAKENGTPAAQDEKGEGLVGGCEEAAASSVTDGISADAKPVEAGFDVAEEEKEGADELKPQEAEPYGEHVSAPAAETLPALNFDVGGDEISSAKLGGDSAVVSSELAEKSMEKLDGGGSSSETIADVGKAEKGEGLGDQIASSNQEPVVEKAMAISEHVVDEPEAKPDVPVRELAAEGGDSIAAPEVKPLPRLAEDSKSGEAAETPAGKEIESGLELSGDSQAPNSVSDREVKPGGDLFHVADNDSTMDQNEVEVEEEGLVSDEPAKVVILESSDAAKQIIEEMEEGSSRTGLDSGFGGSRHYAHNIDGQIASDSDEEVETDEEGDDKEIFDSAALAALLKAATGDSPDGSFIVSSSGSDASRTISVDRPAGLGSSIPALKPAPTRPTRQNVFASSELAGTAEAENEMTEDEKKLHEKVELIRVKFLRLVQRLGHSPEDTVAAQVLYRLNLAEGIRRGRPTNRAFSLENAKKKALQLETNGEDDLDFSCNILVLGKTGVGKSATINSLFGEERSQTNAFAPATTSVKEIVGTVDGVKIRVIDTPGLRASVMDQASNRRILLSVKKYTKRCPPDIVLYVDRMDTQTRDLNDLPLLKTITSTLGSSIWFNAIVALTHAASAPPDGPNGSPLNYEVFVAQRSHVVQQSIRHAAGDMRLMNPVALVENHPSCRRNREGERVLPNGLSWRPQMLLLSYSSKILSEANSLLKLQDPSPSKLFGFRRSPPLPFLLSSLLQSRAHPKLATDQGGELGDSDIDLDDFSDAEQEEEEDEYDQLPPFKPLRKSQIAKLTKEQRKAYFDEYDYRVKLLQKKQWKEELRRLKEMKKRGKSSPEDFAYGDAAEDFDQDSAPAAVPVPLPDMALPPSFDCDSPAYRYRFLEPTSQLLARPVLDTHGWDHDCGYDGVSLEESLAVAGKFPAAVSVQVTKDKKEFSVHFDSSIAAKHGEHGSTLAGFDIQTIGKQRAYFLRGETKFKNLKKNKTAAGISVTFLGENVATGLKLEDQLSIGKRVSLVASTGAVRAQGDMAYGANLEARLREKDFPIGQAISTLGLSLMKWRSDLALGANLQSQFSVGRSSKIAVRVGLNNKLSGQITVRTSSSEQLQIALVGILPIAMSIFRSLRPSESFTY